MEFMPEHAPLVVMAFLGTALLLAVCSIVLLVSLLLKKKWVALGAAVLGTCVASVYALVLLGVSLTTHEKTLAPGENKYFCEIDCHIAYSVTGVDEAQTLGNGRQQINAAGRFVIVRLKTWFDPSTISPHRGNGPLAPGPRRILLLDDRGQAFSPSAEAQQALAQQRGSSAPLTEPLRPGEFYLTDLAFDVPASARNLRLFVGDTFAMPDRVLIGHEDSFLHPKIFLALTAPTPGSVSAGRLP